MKETVFSDERRDTGVDRKKFFDDLSKAMIEDFDLFKADKDL